MDKQFKVVHVVSLSRGRYKSRERVVHTTFVWAANRSKAAMRAKMATWDSFADQSIVSITPVSIEEVSE